MTDERRLVSREELAAALAQAEVGCIGFGGFHDGDPDAEGTKTHQRDAAAIFAALPQPATEPALLTRWAEADLFSALDAEGWLRGMPTADATKATRQLVARLAALPQPATEPALDSLDWEAIENCLSACANDPREPQRYSEWYAEVLGKVRARLAAQPSAEPDGIFDGPTDVADVWAAQPSAEVER